jgi:ABC-type multidrug transport system fused ATPase/permease subunit
MMASERSATLWTSADRLFRLVDRRGRRMLAAVVALTVVGAFTELLTIGAVVPFLALLAAAPPGRHMHWIHVVFAALGARSHGEELVAATVLLCAAAVVSGILRLVLTWVTQKFVSEFGQRLSVEVQRRMLLQPYSWHVRHNSSDQLAAIAKVEILGGAVLTSLIQASAASVLVVVVLALLLQIAPVATIAAGLALGAAYYLLGVLSRRRYEAYSELIGEAYERRIRIVQEGLGGIRDVILDGSQSKVVDQFRAINLQLVQARANAMIVAAVPRSLIESAGIIIIAALALLLSGREGGLIAALPILGALALGAQRLLPLVHQLYHGWSIVASNRYVIDDIVRSLSLPVETVATDVVPLKFERSIEFRDVGYAYAGRPERAVAGLTFAIPHGARAALVGPTGSGKSTTADLLMGLLEPSTGTILVDGVPVTDANRQAWRANLAHVPQMLFVADATIAQNIALMGEVDMARVRDAATIAQLDSFIDSLPEGYETRVGEKGAQISGGQRQRLAIARAVYKGTPLLVFDEATNALDPATEAAILHALDGLQKEGRTIVIIAHRETGTLGCDLVLRLEAGRLAA